MLEFSLRKTGLALTTSSRLGSADWCRSGCLVQGPPRHLTSPRDRTRNVTKFDTMWMFSTPLLGYRTDMTVVWILTCPQEVFLILFLGFFVTPLSPRTGGSLGSCFINVCSNIKSTTCLKKKTKNKGGWCFKIFPCATLLRASPLFPRTATPMGVAIAGPSKFTTEVSPTVNLVPVSPTWLPWTALWCE